MPIKIVDAHVRELHAATRRVRARSPEMQEMIQAVEALKAGQAKALVPEKGEKLTRLRARLSYAAKAAGVKLRVVVAGDRVLFALRRGRGAGQSRAGADARRQAVREAALKLAKSGKKAIGVEDVLTAMTKAGTAPAVSRPTTMVGAVLRNMSVFKRVGKNKFEYRG